MDAAANGMKQEEMQTRARARGILGKQAYQTRIGLVAACERHASGDLGRRAMGLQWACNVALD
jgi:hypothetical protein